MPQAFFTFARRRACQARSTLEYGKCAMREVGPPSSELGPFLHGGRKPQLAMRPAQMPRSSMMAFFSPSTITSGFQNFAFVELTSVKLMMVTRSPGLPRWAAAPLRMI